MFDPTSRYASLRIQHLDSPPERPIAYVSRRFLPQGQDLPLLGEWQIKQGDRLDLIADRTLGRAEQNWRISDANNAQQPEQLLSPLRRRLRIPLTQI